jgi:hypothetical protein
MAACSVVKAIDHDPSDLDVWYPDTCTAMYSVQVPAIFHFESPANEGASSFAKLHRAKCGIAERYLPFQRNGDIPA